MENNREKTVGVKDRIVRYFGRSFLIVSLLIAVFVGTFAAYLLMNKTREQINSATDAVVRGTNGWFEAQIGRVNVIADVLAHEDYVGTKFGAAEDYLAYCIEENPAAYAYYFGLSDDRCVFSDGWEVPEDYRATERDWYPDAIQNPTKAYVSAAYVDADTGRIVVTISKAIVQNGNAVGVFAADFFVDDLLSMAKELSDKSSFAVLVDRDGTVLTHKNEAYIPTTDAEGEMVAKSFEEIGISKKLIGQNKRVNATGGMIYTAEYNEATGVTVLYATGIMSYYGGLFLFDLLSLAIIIFLYIVTTKKIRNVVTEALAPLSELTKATENMKNGKLDYTSSYAATDEICELCVAIEQSNASVKEYIEDISDKLAKMAQGDLTVAVTKEYIGDFAPLKESINNIVASMKDAITIISGASKSVYSSAQNVQGGAESLADDCENVMGVVTEIENQIEMVQTSFDKSLTIVNEAGTLSKNAIQNLEEGSNSLGKLVTAMDEIKDKSSAISAIIDIINSIAEQTNLLALNASIEAARAGEAGRGFAVVADSVRSLAEDTAEAAARTTALIGESEAAVKRGNELVDSTTKKMEQIVEITNEVNERIQGITGCIEEEDTVVKSVKKAVETMESYSTNTQATSQECVALSNVLNAEADNMQNEVNKFTI